MTYRQSPEVTHYFRHNKLGQYYHQKHNKKPIIGKLYQHAKTNKHHYHFIALSITLGFLAATALVLAQHPQ